MMDVKRVLTVAGSDSSGGAGIQADLKTFQALGVFGTAVVTAVTVQNTSGVKDVFPIPAKIVYEQMKAVFEDIGIDAMKTGMLFNADIVRTVVRITREFEVKNLVVDPVIESKNRKTLLESEGIRILKEELIPLCTVITPNIPEAQKLTGIKLTDARDLDDERLIMCGREILKLGAKCVVIKGGHTPNSPTVKDIIITEGDFIELVYPRIKGYFHGTGCTFSAAITAYLAMGLDTLNAIRLARAYLQTVLEKTTNIKNEKEKGYSLLKH